MLTQEVLSHRSALVSLHLCITEICLCASNSAHFNDQATVTPVDGQVGRSHGLFKILFKIYQATCVVAESHSSSF